MNDIPYCSKSPVPFRVDVYSWQNGVTGSATLLVIHFSDGRVRYGLIDAGIVMGEDKDELLHFDPKILDFIIITHPHADHVAKLPLLYNRGCTATIYTTHMNDLLLAYALRDAGKIMMSETSISNTKPWYNENDIETAIEHVIGKTYFNSFEVSSGVKCVLVDNGHMIGACSVLLIIEEDGSQPIVEVFSGDYKSTNELKDIRGFEYLLSLKEFHWLKNYPIISFVESTYGEKGRSKKRDEDRIAQKFANEVLKAVRAKKTLLIPTLSFERPAIELLRLKKLQDQGLLSVDVPIYIGGPVMKEFLNIMMIHQNILNEEFMPENVHFLENVFEDENKEVLIKDVSIEKNKPKIIIASSGMGQFGISSILIRKYLPRKNAKILFTCYLAEGTNGRTILDAIEKSEGKAVWINGYFTLINAEVVFTNEFSGHASPEEIIENCLRPFNKVKTIFLNHGNPKAIEDFGELLKDEFPKAKIVNLCSNFFVRNGPWGLVTSKPLPKVLEVKKK